MIVIICAVNSSSKYLVSVSDVTCGLNGGTSYEKKKKNTVHLQVLAALFETGRISNGVISYSAFYYIPKISLKMPVHNKGTIYSKKYLFRCALPIYGAFKAFCL